MSNRQLNTLISRVEAASGGDRELDDAIFAAMGFCKHEPEVRAVEIAGELELLTKCAKCGNANTAYPMHRYTASLDAAMSLYPEGARPIEILHEAIDRCGSAAQLFGAERDAVFLKRLPQFVTAACLRAIEHTRAANQEG